MPILKPPSSQTVVPSSPPIVPAGPMLQDVGTPDEDDEWLILPNGTPSAPTESPATKLEAAKSGLRPLSYRPKPVEVIAKPLPEPSYHREHGRDPIPSAIKPSRSTGLLKRSLLMVLLLVASAALIFGLLKLLNQKPLKTKPQHPRSKVADSPVRPALTSPLAETGKPALHSALPTPPSEPPILIEPAPSLPDGMEAKAPAMEALAVLETFLTAKTLAERLPMMETKTPETELATSCLAGTLPVPKSTLLDMQESNPLEELVDFYFNVDFEGSDKVLNSQTLLVRVRGREKPKVVVDPFLDLYGGRLAAYASKPSDQAATFQVIASVVASCNDPKIPEPEKKLTLKLLNCENGKEIAPAYFGRSSKIHEMLEDGTYSLSYANARACTVMLRWNSEDNPNYPYLEAIRITALDWNP